MTARPSSTETIASLVGRHARERADDVAFIEAASGEAMTWHEYDERSSRMAGTLATAYDPGDRIAIQLPDGPAAHAVMLACEKAGIVAVGIGARAGAREVAHLVERTGARALLTVEPPESEHAPQPAMTARDLWFLNSTSGTTGLPKIVMHDQARWFAFHEIAQRIAQFDPADVFLSALPAPFGFGLWTAHFTPTIVGAPCIVCARFDAEQALAAIERYRVTVLAAVSTQFVMLLNSPAVDTYDLSSLRVMFTGGEMVPYERAREFEQRTGAAVLQFYGSNETGALSATTPDDPPELRLRTAGRVLPEMQVRLLDPDTDADSTATGGPGVPAGRGPTLCLGYWDDARANEGLWTRDGWMRMGDLATIDAKGYLTVVGRTSDVIIRGGKNVSAAQVEDEVGSHPAVALCAAVAMPDATFGERVCVFVELRSGHDALTLEALNEHLAGRGVGKELWPERLEVVDALPRSSGGKLAKGELVAIARTFAS
ncbi:MAG TPA: class I adenylate-forming enzyme family protein [Acidimicrobiia bacterium]|nr:class I adenylate-forming enzyme family protein [Acidimicrobiia bacterium]